MIDLSQRWQRLHDIYDDYPQQFWLLIGATFIARMGNALIFPFFALFITDRFNVGMTEVGVLMGIFALSGMVGGTIGGALADRMGRKPALIFALLLSAFGNVCIALVPEFWMLCAIAVFLGVFGSIGGPAGQAMVADLLPEAKRAEGYGIFRVVFNLAVVVGPMIGGLLAGISFLLIFFIDALTSLITATILFFKLRETKPETAADAPPESITQTFQGYGRVLRDSSFIVFVALTFVVSVVYLQMNTTLSVFLRDEHGLAPKYFGVILSINAMMVVLFQFGVTRRVRGYPPLLVLAAGTLLYAVGFGLYGFVAGFALFVAAMVIITIGELLAVPVGQAMAAQFAPEAMRGRYMAVFGFAWGSASGVGTLLAGLVMDNADPRWVWYLGGIAAGLAALGYALQYRYLSGSEREAVVAAAPATEPAG